MRVKYRQHATVIIAEVRDPVDDRIVAALHARHEGRETSYALLDWPNGWGIAVFAELPTDDDIAAALERREST